MLWKAFYFICHLGRIMLIGTGTYLRRSEFNGMLIMLTAVLGVVLPYIPQNGLSEFFKFESPWELVKYILMILLLIIVAVIFLQMIGMAIIYFGRMIKINAQIEENKQEGYPQRYFSLRIRNNETEDLTDCRATILIAEKYQSGKWKDILPAINPNDKLMSWGAGSKDEMVTIYGEGSKILNIAYYENNDNQAQIIFPFFGWTSDPQSSSARYRVKIRINGKIDKQPFPALKYEGCLEVKSALLISLVFSKYNNKERKIQNDKEG